NPTGRKQLAAELVDGDFSRVEADAISQIDAGAHILDVNTGVPMADEPTLMVRAVKLVQPLTHATVSVDSFMPEALKAGLESNHC
ncbi:MAG: dihydropteroate synthase, partial [SAR324 cluster bacterium]|nr:dihydropteroate synthase [SAR324 cluster bacterium]